MEDKVSLGKRLSASLIDFVIIAIITVILSYTTSFGQIYGVDLLYIHYYTISLWLKEMTVGDVFVKIKTVRSNNKKLGFIRAFLKGLILGLVIIVISVIHATWWSLHEISAISFIISASVILLVFLFPILRNKSLLDIISGSKVISNK